MHDCRRGSRSDRAGPRCAGAVARPGGGAGSRRYHADGQGTSISPLGEAVPCTRAGRPVVLAAIRRPDSTWRGQDTSTCRVGPADAHGACPGVAGLQLPGPRSPAVAVWSQLNSVWRELVGDGTGVAGYGGGGRGGKWGEDTSAP